MGAVTSLAVHRLGGGDRDQYLIGTPVGVFDLRTGVSAKDGKGSDWYISHVTGCAPAPKSDCPLWKDFLAEAMGGGTALQAHLQRLAGYLLTGSPKEQSLVWFLGEGANGKTTWIETIMAVMGDYAHSLPVEALVASRHSVHPTEICDLKGRRLVVTNETDSDRVWREALLKQLSGGDKITARKVYKDSISFLPSHKLIIVGNHPPQLSAVTEAERRTYQIVEWKRTFKYADDPSFSSGDLVRDDCFSRKLEAEYPMILTWMMEGTKEWIRLGLAPPDSVLLSSAPFLEGQDVLAQWLRENTQQGSQLWQESTVLFEDWSSGAEYAESGPAPNAALRNVLNRKDLRRVRPASATPFSSPDGETSKAVN